MCTTCGCSPGETRIEANAGHDHVPHGGHGHDHSHSHAHSHSHGHHHHHEAHDHAHARDGSLHYGLGPAGSSAPGQEQARLIRIEQDILAKNNAIAAANRRRFAATKTLALNLVSSPGAGKTSLLVALLERLQGRPVAVVEGDQETSNDAERIRETGTPAIQVNTGKGCHLDADMVAHALEHLPALERATLFIENVGNLVCPAGFDLGEAHKVVIVSVTEGEDKPLKYPGIFAASNLMIVTKTDLAPHIDFDLDLLVANARRVRPGIGVLRVSARTGEGLDALIDWIEGAHRMHAATTG